MSFMARSLAAICPRRSGISKRARRPLHFIEGLQTGPVDAVAEIRAAAILGHSAAGVAKRKMTGPSREAAADESLLEAHTMFSPLIALFRRTLTACLLLAGAANAQVASPHALDIPAWFSESFLDFNDEAAAAAGSGKRLMLYFGQDGCPYCRELLQTNFSQKPIVDKTRANFVAIALNIWGDRETTWFDGQRLSEKALARFLKVQFTPTLLFLGTDGRIVARLNGYYPPHKFSAALDYLTTQPEPQQTLAEYLAQHVNEVGQAQLNAQPFLMKPPFDLRRSGSGKPLAVIFETRHCKACDEMHREGLRRADVRAQLARFDVARFALSDPTEVTTPAGAKLSAQAWARELKIAYTPSIVFFDAGNREVLRIEGYVRPFHLGSAFEYVAQGAYRNQPEFQRFLQAKAERARAKGQRVDLWK
jgi:thioredoxin-related protein